MSMIHIEWEIEKNRNEKKEKENGILLLIRFSCFI